VRSDSFRFSPPRFDLPAEVAWTLLAAFSPTKLRSAEHLDRDKILECSHLLALGERIASRHSADVLTVAIGHAATKSLIARQRRTAGRSLLLIELARMIADCAKRLGTPIALLKGLALLVTEISPVGSRDIYDVDALVSGCKAQPLAEALLEQGLEQSDIHESSQHLPALIHPRMGVAEIHVSLRELRIDSDTDARFEDLESRSLLTPAPDPGNCLVPQRHLMAAHSLAHGIAQHGRSPQGYPFLRMLADLQDIGARSDDFGDILEAAYPFLRQTVSERELAAVLELERSLRQGRVPTEGDGAALVRHTVAGYLFPEYERSLKIGAFWSAVRRRDWQKISRRIGHSLTAESRTEDRQANSDKRGGAIHSSLGILKVGWAWLKRSR
jgi:hypothetical protein